MTEMISIMSFEHWRVKSLAGCLILQDSSAESALALEADLMTIGLTLPRQQRSPGSESRYRIRNLEDIVKKWSLCWSVFNVRIPWSFFFCYCAWIFLHPKTCERISDIFRKHSLSFPSRFIVKLRNQDEETLWSRPIILTLVCLFYFSERLQTQQVRENWGK